MSSSSHRKQMKELVILLLLGKHSRESFFSFPLFRLGNPCRRPVSFFMKGSIFKDRFYLSSSSLITNQRQGSKGLLLRVWNHSQGDKLQFVLPLFL